MHQVTQITMHYPPAVGFGGIPTTVFHLSCELSRLGMRVRVIASDATEGGRLPAGTFPLNGADGPEVTTFRYLADRVGGIQPGVYGLLRHERRPVDLYALHGIYGPFLASAIYARRRDVPYIVYPHGQLTPWALNSKRWKKFPYFHFCVKAALNKAACLAVTSEQEMEECRALGLKAPYAIIPNGIDVSLFETLPRPTMSQWEGARIGRRSIVLFLSVINRKKGLDLLVGCWKSILARHPDTLLVVAGNDMDGSLHAAKRMAATEGLGDSIVFTGGVYGREKMMLYAMADIFVLPSRSENFGNVVLEAMAAGLPLVTTRATPWREVEELGCGRWVPVDRGSIAEALDYFLSMDETRRKELGTRARRHALASYSWQSSAARLKTVIDAVLAGGEVPLRPDCWKGDNR